MENLRLGATYFQNEFENLIISVPAPRRFYSTLQTPVEVATLGVETFATWTPLPDLTLQAIYTWLPVAEDLVNISVCCAAPAHGQPQCQLSFPETL